MQIDLTKPFKIKVETNKQSAKVQQILFDHDIKWCNSGKSLQKRLCFYINNRYGSMEIYAFINDYEKDFDNKDLLEISYTNFIAYFQTEIESFVDSLASTALRNIDDKK